MFEQPPFLTFRWVKGAGELYGRSPVMTALPDIKTANKVVELILKNASIAVTGIWLADDDGVLNPANIKLVPGSIIPKAVGSAGLTPLQAPGRFDVSQLVLDDLRARIRHTLLTDRLGPVAERKMTATEVLERCGRDDPPAGRHVRPPAGGAAQPAGAPGGTRSSAGAASSPASPSTAGWSSCSRERPWPALQAREDVQNVLLWLDTITRLGPQAAQIDQPAEAARWLALQLGVPDELVRDSNAAGPRWPRWRVGESAMPESDLPAGWAWFDRSRAAPVVPDELCRDAAGLLRQPPWRPCCAICSSCSWTAACRPRATDAELRHVEGQRSVVAHILALVERGRG